MTLDLDKYAFTDGATALSAAELNKRFYGLVRRLHALELLSIDWSTAIAQVQNYGLARINDAVQPLIDSLKTDLTAVVAQGEAALASQSAAVDAKLNEADVQIASIQAAVSEALASQSAAVDAKLNEADVQIASIQAAVSEALASQSVAVDAKLVEADAQMAVMQAAANAALVSMAEHVERRDNPHEVTARMIGAMALDTSSEVPVTASGGLPASAFGKMHICTGTANDYGVWLPPAAGHAGELIGIRVAGACTKLITIISVGSDLIDGLSQRIMWAGEAAILLCDGVGWKKIAGKSIPMICRIDGPSGQSIPASTYTSLLLTSPRVDVGGLSNTPNNRAVIRRPGLCKVSCQVSLFNAPPGIKIGAQVLINGEAAMHGNGDTSLYGIAAVPSFTTAVLYGDLVTLRGYHTNTAAVATGLYGTYLSIEEVSPW